MIEDRPWRWIVLLGCTALLSACAGLAPQDFAASSTHFELDRWFVGDARSWGVFENLGGQPKRTFVCDSHGVRQSDGAVALHQRFRFNNGQRQTRDWIIRRVDSTHWIATANDMVGVARAECEGNTLRWEYDIRVDAGNPLTTVHIRQWIYQPEGTDVLMTRLIITKLGLPLFEVSETIHHVARK